MAAVAWQPTTEFQTRWKIRNRNGEERVDEERQRVKERWEVRRGLMRDKIQKP